MFRKQIELLSPVGSFESLHAAIHGGADAVYFGVEQLNMRANSASAFSMADIKKISEICRANGTRSYLALNTIMYQHDMKLMHQSITEAKKHCINAIIASDFAVIDRCNQLEIPVHISTQANISNVEAVIFYSQFADAVVLARELTLTQVSEIRKNIGRKSINGRSGEPMKLEVFVHGSLCMAVSGMCYLSLHTQYASANRGACRQVCRRPYKVFDAETNEELRIENEYIMSPKDLCTINFLDQIIDAGATILKIEGRTKGPEYVYTVTKCYNEALQSLEENVYTQHRVDTWIEQLSRVYNRGFWDGYYLGRKTGEWTKNPGSSARERKIYVGKGSKYYPRIKVGEFIIEAGSIREGDIVLITGPGCGVAREKICPLIVNGRASETAVKGDKITFPFGNKITKHDKIYKIIETE